MRLGFAVKVLGRPGLKSNDTRRWQNEPHLSVSLAYLRDILVYLEQNDIHMYRLSSDLAPYVTHPDLPQFHHQIEECAGELAAIGQMAKAVGVRLSFHPAAYVTLNSPDESTALKAAADLEAQARMLDYMQLGSEGVMVLHVGGLYNDRQAAIERFVARFGRLSEPARRRLVLENDERSFSLADTYAIHRATGIRLVLDQLHYLCNPSPNTTLAQALHLALSTWPADQVPKIHYSSPRTAMVPVDREQEAGEVVQGARFPRLSQHADLIDPFSFIDLLRAAAGQRDFDVMLECKAKDLALLRLRENIKTLAPDVVARYAIV